jgi:hypothetical protein
MMMFIIWTENINKVDQIYKEEDLYSQQRSKLNWLLERDLNTKIFHSIANNKYRKHYIFSLEIDGHIALDKT